MFNIFEFLKNEYVSRATNRLDSAGLGSERPDGVSRDDDEFDAYRKRMMLAYRFRPNPLVNITYSERRNIKKISNGFYIYIIITFSFSE